MGQQVPLFFFFEIASSRQALARPSQNPFTNPFLERFPKRFGQSKAL